MLWVDAVCINQLDPVEKGHQVAQMGRIYENAERVVVWLGFHKGAPGRVTVALEDVIRAHRNQVLLRADADREDVAPPQAMATIVRLSILKLLQQPW
jgi:hypothetical protein